MTRELKNLKCSPCINTANIKSFFQICLSANIVMLSAPN